MSGHQQRLRNDIVAGDLPLGSRLIIEDLATRHGVSGLPIREALRVLRGERLVLVGPKRGAQLRPICRGCVEHNFGVPDAIATMLAWRAARRRTAGRLQNLRRAVAPP